MLCLELLSNEYRPPIALFARINRRTFQEALSHSCWFTNFSLDRVPQLWYVLLEVELAPGGGGSAMDTTTLRWVHHWISLHIFLCRIGGIWTLQRNLEDMGSSLQIHYMVSLIESLFDYWSWLDAVFIILSAAHFNGQHLLTSCVTTRSFRFSILSLFGLQQLTPGRTKHCSTFLSITARGLILWYCWWHGGYGNTGMVACLKGHHNFNIIMQNIRDGPHCSTCQCHKP